MGNWGHGREMGICLKLQDIQVFIYTGGLQMTQGTVIRRKMRKEGREEYQGNELVGEGSAVLKECRKVIQKAMTN